MRKFIGLAVVIAFLWVSAAPAEALTLPVGPLEVDYNDWSGFYIDTTGDGVADTHMGGGIAGPYLPGADAELRGIQQAATIRLLTTGAFVEAQTAAEALDGMFYDLVVGAGAIYTPGVSLVAGLVPGGRYATTAFALGTAGGRFDMWLDTSPEGLPTDSSGNVNTFQDPINPALRDGPAHWVVGPGGAWPNHDDFPGVSDLGDAGASPWLIGQWVPMPVGPIPGTAVSNPFAGAVYVVSVDLITGLGTAFGFVDVLVNNTGLPIQNDTFWFPGADIYVKAGLGFPALTDGQRTTDGWDTLSDDPVQYTTLPEPATMSLLLVGLVGGAGAYLRRRRAA